MFSLRKRETEESEKVSLLRELRSPFMYLQIHPATWSSLIWDDFVKLVEDAPIEEIKLDTSDFAKLFSAMVFRSGIVNAYPAEYAWAVVIRDKLADAERRRNGELSLS